MADTCSWDSIPSSGSGELSDFLRLKSGQSYKIRPILESVKFFKYFHKNNGKLITAICGNPNTCPVKDKHPDLKKPSLRFAAYVIDRADGKVKILEAPQSVFRPIGASLEMTGKNPGGGADGSDWYIKVSGTGLNTTYDVGFIQHSPLTPEEKILVREALKGENDEFDKEKLKKLYKIDTPAEIEEKLFGEGSGQGTTSEVSTSTSTSTSAPLEAPVASQSAGDFDNEW